MDVISQTTFSSIFSNENVRIWIKISLKFVPKGPITTFQHWFRQWLGADQVMPQLWPWVKFAQSLSSTSPYLKPVLYTFFSPKYLRLSSNNSIKRSNNHCGQGHGNELKTSKYQTFHSRKWIWKRWPFCPGLDPHWAAPYWSCDKSELHWTT